MKIPLISQKKDTAIRYVTVIKNIEIFGVLFFLFLKLIIKGPKITSKKGEISPINDALKAIYLICCFIEKWLQKKLNENQEI